MASYGEADIGFGDPGATVNFEGVQDASAWQWGDGTVAEEPLMPFWEGQGETPEHQATVFSFHTEPCADFQNGYCSLHKSKGKSSTCFCYHFESQHRRQTVDPNTGRILYWDVPCQSLSSDVETPCPSGDDCVFAHSREEISYHPAKYKTRKCNGRGCRGENICCFAHSDAELRGWAPDRYSYWSFMAGPDQNDLAIADVDAWPGAAGEDWQKPRHPEFFGNSQPPTTRHKQRFCASYPDVSQCRRGAACAFAHTREEARTPLLTEEQEKQEDGALTGDFFMYHFKTLWCPIGVQHDWQTCVYAHNYQDARRRVDIGYGPKPCAYWAKKDPTAEYAQRCPLGLRCPCSHGAKEQLYHPQYFRTVICRDLRTGANGCPRGKLCAFFHGRKERRKAPNDNTDYNPPMPEENLPSTWVTNFLMPPFRDAAPQNAAPGGAADAMQMELELMEEDAGIAVPGSHEDAASQYWCSPGAYWDLNAAYTDEMQLLPSAMDMCQQDGQYSGQLHMPGLLDSPNADSDVWSLSMSPMKLEKDKNGSPRINGDESDTADDTSTSAGGDFVMLPVGSRLLAAASRPKAGLIGTAGAIGTPPANTSASTGGSSSASSSPWMVPSSQEPSWGPFGGTGIFDGFHCSGPLELSSSSPVQSIGGQSSWRPMGPSWGPLVASPAEVAVPPLPPGLTPGIATGPWDSESHPWTAGPLNSKSQWGPIVSQI